VQYTEDDEIPVKALLDIPVSERKKFVGSEIEEEKRVNEEAPS